ncbi:TPA: DUF521 domain-containing protein [Candidatus Micrarchaeota archaeon]|nr:DUF521 domain-containing protein [Candidatus Micrarchaeota archaeon]
MELTSKEQKMLEGELGEAARQSMEILFALGKIYGAQNLIPVSSVQVAGVSCKTIGEAGLDYLRDLSSKGAKVKVKTFLNPAGMDREQWQKMRVPEGFAKKQIAVLDAYASMGIDMTCTCAPYLVGLRPKKGEHIAWSESSAVVFANSVLGARTNREGGPSALAAAICGVTPNYGMHLDKNRVADFTVKLGSEPKSATDFGALGAFVGEASKGKNTAFFGLKKATEDQLKGLGAALASWGSNALFFAKGITPEWRVSDSAEEISVGQNEITEMKGKMGVPEKPDLITLGCPHASLQEIGSIAALLRGKKLACELWVCTARQTKEKADKAGYSATIEKAGGKVVADTCMVVCPLEEMGYRKTATHSGKAAKYLGSLCKQQVVFDELGAFICK